MRIAILSDIHGNLTALRTVLSDIDSRSCVQAYILLGDLIDYGPHSNEVINLVRKIDKPVICNIFGNHEDAIMNQRYDRFSSDRGRKSARYTLSRLTEDSLEYLKNSMDISGRKDFWIEDKECLAVHGNETDVFWGSIKPGDALDGYEKYDYVFSGHSHEPHFFEKYYKVDDPKMRNRKKTIFINPGSVGQPRNQNCHAQYAIFDSETEEVSLIKVAYDIENEMRDFSDEIDAFYRGRIQIGV